MSVGIVKVDAIGIAGAAVKFDTRLGQHFADPFQVAGFQAQRHVIDFTPAADFLSIIHFKERHALIAAFQKALPLALLVDGHAEKIDVEFARPGEILDVKHDVVDAADFER